MSGVCGWYDASPAGVTEPVGDIAKRMAGGLPGGTGTVSSYSAGALCQAGADNSVVVDQEAGLAAAVSGDPQWTEQKLAACAADRGHAAALLQAYQQFGDRLANCLSGPFSFALLDYRNGRTLLAIDRMGIRPLCYALTSDGGAVFGTTASSVSAHPAVSSSLSSESLYRYLYFHVVPSPATIFSDISKLEPAQIVIIERASIRREFYWQAAPGEFSRLPEKELLAELKKQTRQAVERSNPDELTGCFLSGGLDSSTVSGLANEMTDQPMRCYTVGFDQQGFDETDFAKAAVQHFGLEHIVYYITPSDVASAFDILSTSYDEPFGNSSAIPAYFCAKRAREDGVTRLLAGDGGDELFAGNERYAKQTLFEQYYKIPSALRRYLLEPTFDRLRFDRPTLLRKIWRYIEQAKVPMPDRLQTYNFLEMFSPSVVFTKRFLDTVNIDTPSLEMREWYERGNDFDFLNRMLLFDWKLTLADNDIRKVNRMCEAAGVAVDYPLMDETLVDFSLQIPPRLKLRKLDLRYAFKQAHSDYLPAEVLTKEKHGFGLPFGDWLSSSEELQAAILPRIDSFRQRDILTQEFIDDIMHRHRDEHAGYFGSMLWLIAVLENWLVANNA